MLASGISLLIAAAASPDAGQAAADAPSLSRALSEAIPSERCKTSDPTAVVVCGRSGERFRIDPDVLKASRAAEAQPVPPPVTADSVSSDCVGPQHCGDGVIPLVGVALTAVKAAAMAAQGDDWREAFRTHPDEYRAYQEARSKRSKGSRVSFGVSVDK